MIKELHIGVTGSRTGCSREQEAQLASCLRALALSAKALGIRCHLHHGDCVGVDQIAHALAKQSGNPWVVHVHPPIPERFRAFTKGDVNYNPRGYLDRNHDIVDVVDVLLVVPRFGRQNLGTWSTCRYARDVGRGTVIIRNADPGDQAQQPYREANAS